jgi:PPOX class probable F420-dependent enzyme
VVTSPSIAALDNEHNIGNAVSIIIAVECDATTLFTESDAERTMLMLLPLATEPFTAPTDREMLPSERRQFVRTHRTCVFGYRRKNDGPAMSVVYYIPTDDDELLVSTMAGRGKARVIARDGKVSLCVLDERWPFAYLQVYADAVIERNHDLVVNVMMAVAGRMSGQPLPDEGRPVVEAMAEKEDRVVVRCRPYATFAQPPRHLYRNDQEEQITHWVSGVVPWDAPDPA